MSVTRRRVRNCSLLGWSFLAQRLLIYSLVHLVSSEEVKSEIFELHFSVDGGLFINWV